ADIAVSDEPRIRASLTDAISLPPEWMEEVILQSYLFAGFPRALNAAREWRRISGRAAPATESEYPPEHWKAEGERTCSVVYGEFYNRLRTNIRALHPMLDAWMISEG